MRLDLTPPKAGRSETLTFPGLAEGEGESRITPSWRLALPSVASLRAARSLAYRAVPGRDEGEGEKAYVDRLRDHLAAHGAILPEGRLDLMARVEGATEAVVLSAHAEALILDWDGFGDAEGEAIEPDAVSIRAAMRIPYVSGRFENWLNRKLAGISQEGNG
ncbi:hypothetical protein ABWI01_03385 [Oceanicaulis alexandrii]|uniref:hypothetical protein n=1 Tax=Oceanicaulis alexandrii TaxID=153233 RepID=UPI0035D087AA